MSVKGQLRPYQTVESGDMSAQIISKETDVGSVDNIGIQADFTGTPSGTFSIQGSVNGAVWIPLDFGTTPVASGAPDSMLFNIQQFPYAKIRLVYSPSGGSGSLNVWITAKRLGG